MQSEEAKFLKRKMRFRSIDVHPTEKALVVNYELQAEILGDLGDTLLGDKKECSRIIRLHSLNSNTNCKVLAKEVAQKCSLIQQNTLDEVEQLIYYLQNRKDPSPSTSMDRLSNSSRPNSGSFGETIAFTLSTERANINNLEEYRELLYEDTAHKVQGSAMILQLARKPVNLQVLAANDSVLSTLSRVLREDWKRSLDLATNIIYTFFCLSKYSIFHSVVLQYKIGSLCMEIIEAELRRYDKWKAELEAHQRRVEAAANGAAPPRQCLIPVARNKTASSPTAQDEFEKLKAKHVALIAKQDLLLKVSFYLLLNIAEDTKVEEKMRRRNIVGLLTKALDRENPDLLMKVLHFLKKLSLFRENIEQMAEVNLVERLPRVLTSDSSRDDLINLTLRLLFNLSFNAGLRERMLRVGLLPKLVSLINEEQQQQEVLKILYHLSMDDTCKSLFTYTDCIPNAISLLLDGIQTSNNESPPSSIELTALCINLALNRRNAELMIDNGRLKQLLQRAFDQQDSLLMKIIRNISEHEITKPFFVEFVGDLAKAIVECREEAFVVECVGVLGNMTIPDLDFCQLFQSFGLIPWILAVLVPGAYEDDMVLDTIVLLGTAARDPPCSTLFCKADVLISLIELLKAKQEDDEIVLQVVYVFYHMVRHSGTREYLITETDAPAYILDLMHDKNPEIRKLCSACLEIIAEINSEWSEKIKLEQFTWHNAQWFDMVKRTSEEGGEVDETAISTGNVFDNDAAWLGNTLLYLPSAKDDLVTEDIVGGVRPKSRYGRELDAELAELIRYGGGNDDTDLLI